MIYVYHTLLNKFVIDILRSAFYCVNVMALVLMLSLIIFRITYIGIFYPYDILYLTIVYPIVFIQLPLLEIYHILYFTFCT